MTEFIADATCVARAYCPGCEPGADPTREILDVRWCDGHAPARDGSDDAVVTSEAFLSGSAEAGGEANRRWCELLHAASRDRRASRAGRRLQSP
ncbi:MAG: hypothetical protein ACREJV_14785 [Candidatus Rokuibacteriota bacterium]